MRLPFRKRTPPPSSPFGTFTPEMREVQRQNLRNASITGFLCDRIDEIQGDDPDGAEKCRQVIDDCSDRIDCGGFYLRGAVNDMGPLRRLARNWADHPDFRPEWGEV